LWEDRRGRLPLYQNRPDFVDDVTKTFGVFFGFAVPAAVQLQNATLSFTR